MTIFATKRGKQTLARWFITTYMVTWNTPLALYMWKVTSIRFYFPASFLCICNQFQFIYSVIEACEVKNMKGNLLFVFFYLLIVTNWSLLFIPTSGVSEKETCAFVMLSGGLCRIKSILSVWYTQANSTCTFILDVHQLCLLYPIDTLKFSSLISELIHTLTQTYFHCV